MRDPRRVGLPFVDDEQMVRLRTEYYATLTDEQIVELERIYTTFPGDYSLLFYFWRWYTNPSNCFKIHFMLFLTTGLSMLICCVFGIDFSNGLLTCVQSGFFGPLVIYLVVLGVVMFFLLLNVGETNTPPDWRLRSAYFETIERIRLFTLIEDCLTRFHRAQGTLAQVEQYMTQLKQTRLSLKDLRARANQLVLMGKAFGRPLS